MISSFTLRESARAIETTCCAAGRSVRTNMSGLMSPWSRRSSSAVVSARMRARSSSPSRRGSWPRKIALGDPQVLDQVELLIDRPDPAGHGLRRLADGQQLAIDADLALGRGDHARHALDQRRLPGPVGPEQAVHLPGAHVEVHALQGAHSRVLLRDPPDLEQRCALAHPATPAASIDTSTQRSSRAERSTASVMRAARRPSREDAAAHRPGVAGRDRVVDLGDERVEAVRVALRMAGRQRRRSAARRRDRCSGSRLISVDRLAAADPQRLRLLLVEGERLLGAVELEPAGGSCGPPRSG